MMTLVGRLAFASVLALGGCGPAVVGSPDRAALQDDAQLPLAWAYPVNPPAGGGGGGDGAAADSLLTLPGSDRRFTLTQIRNAFAIADWRPDLHPPMPEVVSRGRSPDVRACGFCHYPNGQGRPENASLAGLPAAYIVQQMADYRNDSRTSAEPRMAPPQAMIALARHTNAEDVAAAAEYFAAIEFQPWVRVVESTTVPRTIIAAGMRVVAPGTDTEPIGNRIIEIPDNRGRTELRDPDSGFVAYVPVGSIARGQALVTTGAGRTVRCGLCHGSDLRGLGPVPGIAGRSPSYIARSLYDLQIGARRGAWSGLMAEAVERLTEEDMLALAAYAASLRP